ncbi:MAG: hypothetical protein IIA45_11550 [Bacteroidetes bacterium]|nr:hypothetical protein [Bacteroidota bacterium]
MSAINKNVSLQFALLLFIMFSATRVNAQGPETIPTYHWGYDVIDRFILNNYILGLDVRQKPYNRSDVVQELLNLEKTVKSGEKKISPADLWLVDLLLAEFCANCNEVESNKKNNDISRLRLESLLIYELKDVDNIAVGRSNIRIGGSLQLGKDIVFVSRMAIDQNLSDDSSYVGRITENFGTFTEQSYVSIQKGKFNFLFGRDFLRWGPTHSFTLFISDNSRPFDMLKFGFKAGALNFVSATAQLDDVIHNDVYDNRRKIRVKRYLSVHSLGIKFSKGINIAINEAFLYPARPSGGVEFSYLNPFIFYGLLQKNQGVQGNLLTSIDLTWFFKEGYKLYGELLIDDFQIDNEVVTDLEPDEIGFSMGIETSRLFSEKSSLTRIEYVQIRNRTYNTPRPYGIDRYVHRNKVIGYAQGNDFDRLEIFQSLWLKKNRQVWISGVYLRQGEGRVISFFDEPWLNNSLEEGYSEPFPNGVVEKSLKVDIGFVYQPSNSYRITVNLGHISTDNLDNERGVDQSNTYVNIGVWSLFDLGWEL